MSTIIWRRRVDKVGRVSLFSTAYSVGRAYAGSEVTIRFDPLTREWLIQHEQGLLLKRYPALEITPERILNFKLSKRANSLSPCLS